MDALQPLKNWSPFEIDALGLITIVGITEVDRAVGRLVKSSFAEFAPLLGAFTVASNQITETIPGFTLYNITDGIKATDLTGWFTRWLQVQPLKYNTTVIHARVAKRIPLSHQLTRLICGTIFISLTLGMTIFAIMIGDWWGFVNGVSMVISIAVRVTILGLNRNYIDNAARRALEEPDERVKIMVTLPNGKAVTIHSPRKILLYCLLTDPRPAYPRVYAFTQFVGWFAFGCQIISLGMSSLVMQILTVVLLSFSTVLVVYRVGDDDSRISATLSLEIVEEGEGEVDFRALAYARLGLKESEEESMMLWNLFPHRSNEKWWERYDRCKGDLDNFKKWDRVLSGDL
ncbi:hypothetical protein AA313_de0210061 [Arthrobotrys entomopaga]|nr:hypothetical protein AA313_de0210061 [Arthrobotrys entomopaga]